jgi:hypothetical protein
MKLVKSLLLATAGGLVAVTGATAADLGGIKKPAAVEYVRVCNAYGAGFFYIPGTQTCLRVSGRARWESEWVTPFNANDGNGGGFGYRAIGRLALDARTQSEYGPVRAFVRLDVAYRSGRFASGSARSIGLGFRVGSGGENPGTGYEQAQTQVDLESAFVQFAGFTAGRLATFFEFGSDQSFRGVGGAQGFSVTQLAYTATFGSGFSATLAIEDPINRRQAAGYVTYDPQTGLPISLGGVGPYVAATPWGGSYYGGNKGIPDIVGVLRVDQGWGSAQLSGVLHAVNYGFAPNGVNPDTDYGYALQAGVKINLPMLAPGDNIRAQVTYGKGVTQSVVSGFCGYATTGICVLGKASNFAGNLNALDSVYTGDPVNGFATKLTTTYGAVAYLTHYWTPTVRQTLGGAFAKIDYAGSTQLADVTLWTASTAVIWSPIKDLDIGAEVLYANVRGGHGYALSGNSATAASKIFTRANGGSSEDQWGFRLRVQRDF